jgi:hypothetical protein
LTPGTPRRRYELLHPTCADAGRKSDPSHRRAGLLYAYDRLIAGVSRLAQALFGIVNDLHRF